MKTFKVYRSEDVSGVSGTGLIAEGVEFTDGQVAINWLSDLKHYPDLAPSIEAWLRIHGHNGRTQIVYSLNDPHSTCGINCQCKLCK